MRQLVLPLLLLLMMMLLLPLLLLLLSCLPIASMLLQKSTN
jgi:hypothetical protein